MKIFAAFLALQAPQPSQPSQPSQLPAVTVSARATRPALALDSITIREKLPNNPADLLRELPGVDVAGVGPNQARPIIRGQRGQRILLLENGIRVNNVRRQQDFGELPSLVPVADIARVEIVRGPMSVLYGSDAIGGSINLVTKSPSGTRGGSATLLGGSGTFQGSAAFGAAAGPVDYRVSVTRREADDYTAPRGNRVFDTGVSDGSYSLALAGRGFSVNAEHYAARDAGFGFTQPKQGDPRIQILYPDHNVTKVFAGYEASRLRVTTYAFSNRRDLTTDVTVPLGPTAQLHSFSANFTDVRTLGGRVEAKYRFLTYGIDASHDRSANTDSSTTTVTGFGPPSTQTTTTSPVPDTSTWTGGAFAQSDLELGRVTLTAGARAQLVDGRDEPALVGSVSTSTRLLDQLRLIAAVGRGFRAPNLVERYFDGPVPEAGGYQSANPALLPETALNFDLGLRFSTTRLDAELFAFRNDLRDGIRTAPTGGTRNGQPEYRNVNLDRLRFTGGELAASLRLPMSFALSGSFSALDSKDVVNPNNAVGDSYSRKVVGDLGWRAPSGRAHAAYVVRHNSANRDGTLDIPAFTVHTLRGGVRLLKQTQLTLVVDNVFNTLYTETTNFSFYRPEPGRSARLALTTGF